jgi:hypothetical protein
MLKTSKSCWNDTSDAPVVHLLSLVQMHNSSEVCKTCEVRPHNHPVLLHIPAAELMLFGTNDDDEGALQPLNLGTMLDEIDQQQSSASISQSLAAHEAAAAAAEKAAAGGGSLHWSGAVQLVAFCLFEVLIGKQALVKSTAGTSTT